MLRPFQVNVGCYITLKSDIPPTARVGALCSSIEAFGGEKAESQVLLTADGKQMNPRDLIGNYSVGTDDKPIFVFYRSYLDKSEPPITTSSKIPPKGGMLQKQLEILKLRPSPPLFQHQVALAKKLCEHSLELHRLCTILSEEYSLQLQGWETVLSNCNNIIGLFKKHHQVFCIAVEKFKTDRPHYLDLLQQFPQQVKLLQQIPVPASLQNSGSSLYDWISTHDEKNSLMDLSTECQKALSKVNSEQVEIALQSSGEISTTSREILDVQSRYFLSKRDKIRSEIEEAKEIMETIKGLTKNIQLTSDKAFRSGDAKTIAVLVESHHKSIQIMNKCSTRLEAIAGGAEESKREITCHIHGSLKKIMQLQKKVSDSNGHLVLLHEHIKLAHKRFEILEQVCLTPQVLVEVLSEVERRRLYNGALDKVMTGASSRLREAREAEKQHRSLFQSSHGVHFVTTLFPELQDRVPDVTFHTPKSLRKTHDDSLEVIRSLLPQDLRPSIQAPESVQLLTQIFVEPSNSDDADTISNSPAESLKKSSTQSSLDQSRELTGQEQNDLEDMKEIVGKLELTNLELSSRLQQNFEVKKTLEETISERESAYLSAVQRNSEYEKLVSSLQLKVQNLESSKESFDSEKKVFIERLENLNKTNREAVEKQKEVLEEMQKMAQEKGELNLQCSHFRTEKDKLLKDIKKLNDIIQKLDSEHAQSINRLEYNCSCLHNELGQAEMNRKKDEDAFQTQLAKIESEKILFESSAKDLKAQIVVLELKLTEVQDKFKIEQQRLESELESALTELRIQKDVLAVNSSVSDNLAAMRNELEEKIKTHGRCLEELDVARRGLRESQDEVQMLKESYSREKDNWQEADAQVSLYKAQLQSVDDEGKNLLVRIDKEEQERRELENVLSQKDSRLLDLEKKLKSSEEQIGEIENDLSKEKEKIIAMDERLLQSEQELKVMSHELQNRTNELQFTKEEKIQLNDELEHGLEMGQAKLEKTIREHEEKEKEWSHERDNWVRQVMELERELKELRREIGQGSPTVIPKKQVIHPMSSSIAAAAVSVMTDSTVVVSPESVELPREVAVQGFQIGQVALFMSDQYGNYLALSIDGRTYYLDSECVSDLHDIASKLPQLILKRRILIGKVTGRLYMEVRKENNRLKVPVGTRLYKLKAVQVTLT